WAMAANGRTVADGGPAEAAAEISKDTVASAWDYMAKGGEATTVDSPEARGRIASKRRWLRWSVAGGAGGFGAAVGLWFLLSKEAADPPAEKQVEAVVKKLKELNKGFDGTVTYKIENGIVREFQFVTDKVTDISPVRAFPGLKILGCRGSGQG